ncbi:MULTISPECIES: hypothetical protein [unclassified Kaistella]|uniref:hypothetical protein n=1 Tax=unclassified Kaistella TaxID=2762626 RepID=UPI002732D770|nr:MULTISPECIES: hypothetical protein [unclassified Kaistella]MCZ2085859.1 hypothetical protein [Flavobacteriales bacterium]MDP2453648.1 hypothetical protein [Kaistella sp. SH11-4b]MDP2456705.1 hypothetical protein [Kaistella sp. SH40-3]MDP2459461.1 hypothetical protein [Kaistella sp. SH19-2b]
MKKIFALLLFISTLGLNAQYGSVNAILDILEAKKGLNKNLSNVNIDDVKFVLIKEFADHTERDFIIIKGNKATYVEVFDDKQTGETSSNVFTGDVVRSKNQIVSLRADQLEGKKIPIAITKTFLMTQQKKILYLIDINTKERWIEESSINKK